MKKGVPMLVLWLMIALLPLSGIAEEYRTVKELREETPQRWQQTYEVNGYTICVEVDIDIPDVASIPAIRVEHNQENVVLSIPAELDAYEQSEGPERFGYGVCNQKSAYIDTGGEAFEIMEPFDAYAENNPLSQSDAIAFFQTILDQCKVTSGLEYELYGKVHAFTKSYKRLKDSSIDMTTPVTDIGYYAINLRQSFHGVPYLINVLPRCVPNRSTLKTMPPEGNAYLAFVSTEDYFFTAEPAIETGLLYDDLPLVPFDIVKQTFEQVIHDGYIRSIYSVRLGYAAFHDRSDLDNSYILLPVWELRGQIVDSPQHETPPMEPYAAEYYQQYMGQYAYVNAQTGEYIDPYDSNAERDYATIVYAK